MVLSGWWLVTTRLIRIGYWASDRAPGWPDPHRFVDCGWDLGERETAVDYLRRGLVARAYLGMSPCRLCGAPVGSLELSDGVFIWPEGLAHYLDEHHVRLPARFVEHLRSRTEELGCAEIEDHWWKSQSGPD